MKYHILGNSDLKVSKVCLGTWVMGGDHWGDIKDSECISTIRTAIDCGINFIDTAPAYGVGHAETLVGKAIKGIKDKVIIATKCGIIREGGNFSFNLSRENIKREIEDSLRRLDIEVIDLYQCHWPDPSTPIEATMEILLRLKEEGKIRHIGVSNFERPLLEKALSLAPVVTNQPQYSLLDRRIEKELLPFCNDNKIGTLPYGPLGSGILTGKYKERPQFKQGDARNFFYKYYEENNWNKVQILLKEMKEISEYHRKPLPHVAINWLKQQEGVSSVLVGARNPAQAKENAGALEWDLSRDELNRLTQISDSIWKEIIT